MTCPCSRTPAGSIAIAQQHRAAPNFKVIWAANVVGHFSILCSLGRPSSTSSVGVVALIALSHKFSRRMLRLRKAADGGDADLGKTLNGTFHIHWLGNEALVRASALNQSLALLPVAVQIWLDDIAELTRLPEVVRLGCRRTIGGDHFASGLRCKGCSTSSSG